MTPAQAPGLADVAEVDSEFETDDVTDHQSEHDFHQNDEAGNFQFEGSFNFSIRQVEFELTTDTDSGTYTPNNNYSPPPSRCSDTNSTNDQAYSPGDSAYSINQIDEDTRSLSTFSGPANTIRRSQSYSEFSIDTTEKSETKVDSATTREGKKRPRPDSLNTSEETQRPRLDALMETTV
jgi:hypothetical protein